MSGKAIAITRGVAVIGGTAALMIAATFAAFTTNTVTLSDNHLTTTNNLLQIYNFATPAWDVTSAGFTLPALVPGVESAHQAFYLKNNSASNLAITVSVVSGSAVVTGIPATIPGYQGIHVNFYDQNGVSAGSTNLYDLENGGFTLGGNANLGAGSTGNSGVAGTNGNYQVSFSIDASVLTGVTPGDVSNLDIDFTGTSL